MWFRLLSTGLCSYKRFPSLLVLNRRTYSNQKKWNILFFGTDDFSLTSLKEIHKPYVNGELVDNLEIVTNATCGDNQVSKFSREHSLVQHKWPVDPSIGKSFNLGIVVSFGHLIPKRLIDSFSLGIINVHASLLPRWRGAAPIVHCLLNGDNKTGVSIMRIKPHRFDIGDIIYQQSIDVPNDMLQTELHASLASLGSKLLVQCLRDMPECLQNTLVQNESEVTYAPKIDKSLAVVRWKSQTAVQIYNLSRALHGIHPLVTAFKSHQVKIDRLFLCGSETPTDSPSKSPGRFRYVKKDKYVEVRCGDGNAVGFKSIRVKGRSEMSALEFRNGFMKNLPDEELFFDSTN